VKFLTGGDSPRAWKSSSGLIRCNSETDSQSLDGIKIIGIRQGRLQEFIQWFTGAWADFSRGLRVNRLFETRIQVLGLMYL
jgi:hypothetical protein